MAQLFGLCEKTIGNDWLDRSLSWHEVACLTVPVTSTWPPETPNATGLTEAETTTARGGGVAAVLVATRPSMAHTVVASTTAIVFMARSSLS